MTIGENIRRIRKKKGLTQKQLGERLNMTQSAIGQFENDKASPKIETIDKIAKALEVNITAIMEQLTFEQPKGESESEIEKYLVLEVKRLGGQAYKWVSPGNAGVPDRIVIFRGWEPRFIELKTSNGKLSPLQEIQIKRLRGLGQFVYVLHGSKGVREFIEFWESVLTEGVMPYDI